MLGESGSLGSLLFTLANQYEHVLTGLVRDVGITSQYLRVLVWLEADEGLSQTELAERLQIDDPTLARILKSMERDGWIYRKNSPSSRRMKLVYPMPMAGQIRERLNAAIRQVDELAARGLEESELNQMRGSLLAIRANLRTGGI